jgi:hypothetical protein
VNPIFEEKVDAYLTARQARLAADKVAAELKKSEDALKGQIEKSMHEAGMTDYKGDTVRVQIEREYKPTVNDWGQVHLFIRENDAWDLVQKRLTESAVKSRWEDNISIPGIEKFPVDKLSITKA